MAERPILFSGEMVKAIFAGKKTQTRRLSATWDRVQPGDALYVRETWAAPHDCDHLRPREIPRTARIHYLASEERGGLLWRPSIHMPRWASRLLLRLVNVKRQPLQEISARDCEAEGIVVPPVDYTVPEDPRVLDFEREAELRDQYRELWIKLNGAESWKANPEVRVVEFTVAEAGAAQKLAKGKA